MNTKKSYQFGKNAGLDALEACSKSSAIQKDALAGLMSVVIQSVYAMAPNEEAAEELITLSQVFALEDWTKEKKGKT